MATQRMALVCAGLVATAAQAQDVSFEAARNFGVGVSPISIAVGDFNVDGLPDLAVANSGSNNVSVLLGNGDGSFQAVQNFEAESRPFSIAVADFNGDGLPDSWPTPASSLSQILRFLRVSSRLVLLRHPF